MTVLVLDDNPVDAHLYSAVAGSIGHDTQIGENLEFVENIANDDESATLILDIMLGNFDAFDVLKKLSEQNYTGSIVLVSGFRADYLTMARRYAAGFSLNVKGAFTKPVDLLSLREALR